MAHLKHNSRWFQGISKEKQEDFDDYLSNSKILLDKLDEICYNMLNEVETKSLNDYDSPSWAYKQADYVGYKRALTQIRLLLANVPDRERKNAIL